MELCRKIIRIILIAAEFAFILVFLLPMFTGITNIGAVCGLAVSAAALLITIFFDKFKKIMKKMRRSTPGRVALLILFVLTGALVLYFCVLTVIMICSMENLPYDPDAVIVLGCKVQSDGEPSLMLSKRIEAAYDYLEQDKDVICVASGGKGDDEPESEAGVIKKKLVEMGISEDRIFLEENSANTAQNIELSLQLLKDNGIKLSEVAIVTDGFHQLRASLIAEKHENLKASAVSAKTPPWLVPAYWIREWAGITRFWIFGS